MRAFGAMMDRAWSSQRRRCRDFQLPVMPMQQTMPSSSRKWSANCPDMTDTLPWLASSHGRTRCMLVGERSSAMACNRRPPCKTLGESGMRAPFDLLAALHGLLEHRMGVAVEVLFETVLSDVNETTQILRRLQQHELDVLATAAAPCDVLATAAARCRDHLKGAGVRCRSTGRHLFLTNVWTQSADKNNPVPKMVPKMQHCCIFGAIFGTGLFLSAD